MQPPDQPDRGRVLLHPHHSTQQQIEIHSGGQRVHLYHPIEAGHGVIGGPQPSAASSAAPPHVIQEPGRVVQTGLGGRRTGPRNPKPGIGTRRRMSKAEEGMGGLTGDSDASTKEEDGTAETRSRHHRPTATGACVLLSEVRYIKVLV